ncbi:MAG: histidine--tRNA ligase [Cyclobacteriaceae bacterium]|nr:MAG: histidine--tRNA ligase [Cyclobacteriaceae bacterium]
MNIQAVFQKFGFQPLETPSMENLSVLTGKYGDEGDQLLYKILDSGDYLKKTTAENYQAGYAKLLPKIASKGLRYDLTVPFARYVAMNRHEINFPFKRYQMQPVWRADRPQKGRYREFFQCDADVVGTSSLICEAEIVAMINEVFGRLGITNFSIHINHRKFLAGVAEAIGAPGKISELAVSLDKLTKIGPEKVLLELQNKGFDKDQCDYLKPLLGWKGVWSDLKAPLQDFLKNSSVGTTGLNEINTICDYVTTLNASGNLIFNASLARGLTYYTGSIFEVTVNNADMGSVCGGGRYDDLTGIFGLPDVSGVGISFGVDRIYDVMEQLKLFPENLMSFTNVLLIAMDDQSQGYALGLLSRLRSLDIACELYPDRAKLKKPLNYANKKGIPMVVLIGPEEIESGKLSVKQMVSGEQRQLTEDQLITTITKENL